MVNKNKIWTFFNLRTNDAEISKKLQFNQVSMRCKEFDFAVKRVYCFI